ncbi:ribonuclease inhibitor-like [Cyprinus carpio]|uniref:Ribonuclease inhibitor-like n=1 Tax=Cyprinus carpio TaxID=7962 RepID=A0A9Q9X2Z1_CYPCA|nr:ribonuclease inhibitor-like [Cyprinus carpio]
MAMWNEAVEDELISLIQERPALYDITEKRYANRVAIANSWREIENKLVISGTLVPSCLSCCYITQKGCAALISALRSNPLHLTELNLSCNKPGDSGVKLLSALLEDPRCKLKKLKLLDCSIGEEGCAALISALRSNPSHLTELNLSYNKPGDSGVKLLSALLEDPHCKLEKLQLYNCSTREEGLCCSDFSSKIKPFTPDRTESEL